MSDRPVTKQGDPSGKAAGCLAVDSVAGHEEHLGFREPAGRLGECRAAGEAKGLAGGVCLALPERFGPSGVGVIAGGRGNADGAIDGRGPGHRLGDRELEIGIALVAEPLGKLHHARLADLERVGQLLRRVVAEQVRVSEDVVGDPPVHRRHAAAFGA